MKKFILFVPVIAALFLVGCITKTSQNKSVSFTTDISQDATPMVLSAMMSLDKNEATELKFEKGTYHFYPDKGFEKFCFISNHEDVQARTAFPLLGMKNITIDGQGANFIFHGDMIPFIIEQCENINIKNLTVDWDKTFHSEGLVVANDKKNGTFDLQFSEDCSYEIRNDQLIFVKEYYEHTIGQSITFDPKRKAIAYRTNFCTPVATSSNDATQCNIEKVKYRYKVDTRTPEMMAIGRQNLKQAKELKSGLVRIFNHQREMPAVGTVLISKGAKGLNRTAPAFRVVETVGFNAENVTVYHAGGMGLIAENSENLILNGFNVKPSGNRMLSTTADATHFVGCRGKVELINCTLHNQMDDAMNVHGTYQEVMDVLSENSIGIRIGHFEQQNFSIGRPGDKIGLVRLSNSYFPYGKLTLESIEKINGRYQIITFKENLPADIQAGDLIENLDAYPEVLVENCNISGNRARGLLISTPQKTVVKGNFFHTHMEAILVPVESGFWYESGSASNLTIVDNIFQDCNHGGLNRGLIRFETDDNNGNIAFNDIEINNNEFNSFDNLILEISNTNNLKFSHNLITNTGTFPILYPENPAFKIETSQNIDFSNNTYEGSAAHILETDDALENLTFQ